MSNELGVYLMDSDTFLDFIEEMAEYYSDGEVDGVDSDYSSVTIDYKWLVQELKHRRTTLQNRGRTQ